MNRRRLPENQKYYVYAFVRDSGIPYYIGRGCRYRAWDTKNRTICAPKNRENIKIVKEFLSLEQANALEVLLICFWGRKDLEPNGVLANMQEGAIGGSPGRKMPPEQKELMRLAHLGRKQDAQWVQKRFQWQTDRGPVMEESHRRAVTESIRALHRVWWRHENLNITFFGTSTEVADQFSTLFYTHSTSEYRRLRAGKKLCRNLLRSAWSGKIPHYKGWTRGQLP